MVGGAEGKGVGGGGMLPFDENKENSLYFFLDYFGEGFKKKVSHNITNLQRLGEEKKVNF